jgi:hypothetical protein
MESDWDVLELHEGAISEVSSTKDMNNYGIEHVR